MYIRAADVHLDDTDLRLFVHRLSQPNIFYQEGWHIEYGNDGEAPSYKGVVFNEMKGSMSDTDTLIDRQILKQLFPDTCYGKNSGGDPEAITDLSYETFREQYRRCYHPSNAFFYLDGSVPMEQMLALIDSYLDGYTRKNEVPEYRLQQPVGSERTIYYELGQEEKPENTERPTWPGVLSVMC